MKGSASSTHKQVVIRRLDKALIKGYLDPASFLGANGVEVIDREGRLMTIPLEEIKGIFFVRHFEGNPERAERKVFRSRPRLAGLWLRLTFKDAEVLEGVAPNNLLDIHPLGFWVTPPDVYSNNLRVFVPRTAVTGVQVLGVISDGAARRSFRQAEKSVAKAVEATRQIRLFSPASPPEGKSFVNRKD